MTRKIDLRNIKRQKDKDELELLFSQFDEQLQACEDKLLLLKKSVTVIETKKTEEDELEVKQEKLPPTPSPHHKD